MGAPDIKEDSDDAKNAGGTDTLILKSAERGKEDYMDAPGDGGLYSPTKEIFHQIFNWVDDPSISTASVITSPRRSPRKPSTLDANDLNPTEADEVVNP